MGRVLSVGAVVLGALSSLGFGKEVLLMPARTYVRSDETVTRAMSDELARSMSELHMAGATPPYYLAYALSDIEQAVVTATFGAVSAAYGYQGRTLRTDVRVGDPSFDNSNTSESMFGGNVESLPGDDDYAALRRELWLRTDEAYKNAIETLAKKRSAAAGQSTADGDGDIPDFSRDPPSKLVVPFPGPAPEPDQLMDVVTRLSAAAREFPEVAGSRVTGTYATIRRRFASSEGAASDEARGTVRVDAVAETQAPDGMRLVNFVSFTALVPSGLPPLVEMERSVHHMLTELVAMRTAPIASNGAASILFEGGAAGQIAKLLLGDNLAGTPAPRTASGGEERGQTSDFAERLGQKVGSSLLMAVDDPLREAGPDHGPLFGTYRVDDEGIRAERVTVLEAGIVKGLLMTRTPRKEITHSNGHARATRFGGPHAVVGNLILSGKPGAAHVGLSRPALLHELARTAKEGGLRSYVVRLLDEPSLPGVAGAEDTASMFSLGGNGRSVPSVKPLVVYRLDAGGKEELVRGLTLEGLVPRSLRDLVAMGKDATTYNYQEGGAGFVGIPSSVVTPALLITDVDVRRAIGKNRRPPLYPRPKL